MGGTNRNAEKEITVASMAEVRRWRSWRTVRIRIDQLDSDQNMEDFSAETFRLFPLSKGGSV